MNSQELTERLEEIREEFCPATLADLEAAIEAGYNELCGCSICVLCRDLLIEKLGRICEQAKAVVCEPRL